MRPDSSSVVVLWQPSKTSDASPWWIPATQQGGQGLSSLATALATLRTETTRQEQPKIVLIIPAELTLSSSVHIPSAKPAHIRAAVPHLIEEWTLSDSDALHLSWQYRDNHGQVAVTAIDKDLFRGVLTALGPNQDDCVQAYTDAALLPYTPHALTIYIDDHRTLLKWDTEQSGTIDTPSLGVFLAALHRQQHFKSMDVFCTTNPTGSPVIAELTRQLPSYVSTPDAIRYHIHSESLLDFCADQLTNTSVTAINLRQGEMAPARNHHGLWRRWRPVTFAAVVCLSVQLGLNLIQGWRLNHESEKTHAQAVQLYQELFPGDKRIVNLRQQFQNHLNSGAQSDQLPFFALFGQLTQEIQATQTPSPIQLRSLLFDMKAGNLQVDLIVPTILALDDLQKRLSTKGLQAKVTSTENAGNTVIGRLTLAAKP